MNRFFMMAVLAMLSTSAVAAEIEKVRVFVGADHARILIINDEAVEGVETRSSAPTASAPARATLHLPGVRRGETVQPRIPIGEAGIQQLLVVEVGDGVQFTVELEDARTVHAQSIGKTGILVDLLPIDGKPDPGLPTAEHIEAWLSGVSLGRVAGTKPRGRKLVVVDAGHGGFDHGAIGTTGTREADIALEISRRVRLGLERRLDVDVIMTRDRDIFVPLRDRAALANRENADLFLSIHANAAPNNYAKGIETYSLASATDASAARVAARENAMAKGWSDKSDPLLGRLLAAGTDRLSRDLAFEVQRSVVDSLREVYPDAEVTDLGTKTALFYVLVSTRMPAILFESSFVSQPEDERRLRSAHFQQTIADAVVDAVGTWFDRQKEE
jgi:N-acetylmuramoyl-L-alanine amidase